MSGIMPMVNVPDMVQYGRVTAHLVAFIADTMDDDDQIPDEIPLKGVVVLTPTVGVVRFPTTTPPRTAVVQALRCPIIGGDLYPPDTLLEGPLPAQPGVVVVASSQPVGLPDTVQWTATFELVGARVQPSSVTFEVPTGGVVDLTTVIPATPTPGTVVVVSTESRERAEAAAVTATQKATAAASSATAAASSASNAATSATAAQDARAGAETAADSISWTGLPGKPAVIAAGDTASEARTAIGAADAEAAAFKDTGYRNVSSLVSSTDWSEVTATLRRAGALVTLEFQGVCVNTVPTLPNLIPVGFRRDSGPIPPFTQCFRGSTYWAPKSGLPLLARVHSNGQTLSFGNNPVATDYVSFALQWLTSSAWPVTLPGTPA